jgi:hypothetical protein
VLIETLEKVPEGAEAPRKDGITPEEVEKEKNRKRRTIPRLFNWFNAAS